MPSIEPSRPQISRRRLLQLSGLAGMGWLLGSCESNQLSNQLTQAFEPLNQKVFTPLNQRTEELILRPQALIPEYPISAIEPQALLINTFDFTPHLDPVSYRLTIDGEVNQPIKLSLADLQKMTPTSMVIRHVCVEGWAAIVQWGGVRLQDLIALVQPKADVRYVYFLSADGYYESWDMASAMHPQTLMVYQKNGQPLSVDNGAPLRLASPIKLGYKQSKWVTRIALMSKPLPQRGYWVDQGYEWFGGI